MIYHNIINFLDIVCVDDLGNLDTVFETTATTDILTPITSNVVSTIIVNNTGWLQLILKHLHLLIIYFIIRHFK